MKQQIVQNYSWIDIIEPQTSEPGFLTVEFFAVVLILGIILFIAIKHYKLIYRFKLWRIKKDLVKNNDTRKCAIKLLKLLSLNKDMRLLKHEKTPGKRNFLLNARYSKQMISVENMIDFIKIIEKSY